jgi:hypothetical protein
MNASRKCADQPDFSTLTGIMEYFTKVPFEIFKKELTGWFMKELPGKRPDLVNSNGEPDLPEGFGELIESIFRQAELNDQTHLN